jgi:hypothetical protein
MEAILNIAWVLASILAFVAGILHYRTRERRVHSMSLVAVALAVIALLVFPVISLTDDLHPAIFAAEAASKRDLSSSIGHAPATSPALLGWHWYALPQTTFVDLGRESLDVEVAAVSAGFAAAVSGRDPPRVV